MNAYQAETIARMVHREHKYGDRPYIEAHVAPVVARVIDEGGGEDAVVVAWLHDVLEDSAVTLKDQPMLVLSRPQAVALAAITCKPGEDYAAYIVRVVADPVARLVKYCDLLQNLSCQPSERLRRRYLAALEMVRDELDSAAQLPRRSMMRASQAAAATIDAQLGKAWVGKSGRYRAVIVLEWCAANDWPLAADLFPRMLEVAMQRMPYWAQGPANYFDMARALSAVHVLAELAP